LAASSRGRARARESSKQSGREGAPRSGGRGRGDRGVRGSIAVGAVGRRLPRSNPRLGSTEKRQGSACPSAIRRSVLGCRETPGPLVSRTEPKTPWGVHAVKAAEKPGAHEVRVHADSFRWQKLVGRIARLAHREIARSVGGLSRALAGRKLEAPPDAEHEPREGETVRGKALTIKSTRWFGLWVSARKLSIRRKAFSGFRPSCPHGHGEVRSFGSKVNLSCTSTFSQGSAV